MNAHQRRPLLGGRPFPAAARPRRCARASTATANSLTIVAPITSPFVEVLPGQTGMVTGTGGVARILIHKPGRLANREEAFSLFAHFHG